MISLTIDLGGSRIKIGLIGEGQIIEFSMLDIEYGATLSESLEIARNHINSVFPQQEVLKVSGVGIAYPGLVNFAEKKVIEGNGKYSDANQFNIEKWVMDNFNCPLVMDNDANAALLGEIHYGCGEKSTDAVMLILGTGVGTAALMNGHLVRGKHYQAGCLGGHFPIELNGHDCSCGRKGCVEANASTWALKKLFMENPKHENSSLFVVDKLNFHTLMEHVKKGDIVSRELFEYCIDSWSNCLITLIHAYDPELVIFSGGIVNAGSQLLGPIIDNVNKKAWISWGEMKYKVASNPENSVLLGLHYLLEEKFSH